MVNVESTNHMDHSNAEQHSNLTSNIPGGKQHPLPEEPLPPQGLCNNLHDSFVFQSDFISSCYY